MNRQSAIKITYFLLRVVAGLIFVQSGGSKVLGWFPALTASVGGPPQLWSQVWIGGWMEVIGGVLIIVGLLTRPVAFILAGEMAVAYWQFHYGGGKAPWDAPWTWPVENQGVAAALYSFIFLFMAAYGGGSWSLDAMIWGKRRAPVEAETAQSSE